jgi:glycosyltransferase involved in cell wall biosynthesis
MSFSAVPVVCCTDILDPSWRWIEGRLADTGVRFEFARCGFVHDFEHRSSFHVARLRGCLDAVLLARRTRARAIVALGPPLAAWCAFFARGLGLSVPILAHTFNFTRLPHAAKRPAFAWALSEIDRFVVFSTMERELYSRAFGLPLERIDVQMWGVRPPEVDSFETPLEPGEYVCAIGGNARDYRTLVESARMLPHVRFVLVVRPESLAGLSVPANVRVHVNLPIGKTMNALAHSRFMVLPLESSEVPCGHLTLVAAMHLGKAFVITNSSGVRDYVREGENALTVPAGDSTGLAAATDRLWNDPALCESLGQNGKRFAARECTEERIVEHFRSWLRDHGIAVTGAAAVAATAA